MTEEGGGAKNFMRADRTDRLRAMRAKGMDGGTLKSPNIYGWPILDGPK